MTDRWGAEALHEVRHLATDLSSLLISLEVAGPRHGEDDSLRRAHLLAARMEQSMERLIALLRT